MKAQSLLLVAGFILPGKDLWAQHKVPVAKRSRVEITKHDKDGTSHKISYNAQGTIAFDPKQLSTSSFDITLEITAAEKAKYNSGLMPEQGWHTTIWPKVKITSASMTVDGSAIYMLHGTIVEGGTTTPVTIQFTATPSGRGYLFRGSYIKGDAAAFLEIRTDKK